MKYIERNYHNGDVGSGCLRSYYTVEYMDRYGVWRTGSWRAGYGRRKTRILEAAYRMGGYRTRIRKDTY